MGHKVHPNGFRLGEFAPTRNYRGHGRHTERSTALK